MSYADQIALPPRTLTEGEQRAILKVTGEHARGFRDHVLFSVALGTGLREHEILALNVGDVFGPDDKPRRRVQLRVFKRSNDQTSSQEVVLPDNLRAKLDKLRAWKKLRGESLEPEAPLFVSRNGNRLSDRQRTEDVRLHDTSHALKGYLRDGPEEGQTSVVDQDVQATALREHRGHGRLDRGRVGNVEG